jgi:hypothetical protein
MVRLTLDYWTWRRLSAEGMPADGAADLLSGVIADV